MLALPVLKPKARWSAKPGSSAPRAQNVTVPSGSVEKTGEISQLAIVPPAAALLKFAAIYEFSAPACASKKPDAAGRPWNQPVDPAGMLALVWTQPLPGSEATLSKPSLTR